MTRLELAQGLLTGLLVSLLMTGAARAWPGQVVAELDSPTRYPAGLASDGESLYVVDWRRGRIHRVAPDDGRLLATIDAPTLKPQGLTWGGGRLYVSDGQTGTVFGIDPASGAIESVFEGPGKQVSGLAWTSDGLLLLEGKSDKIYRVIPEDGTILDYFDAPTRSAGCLAHDGKYLWVSDRYRDELYVVDPKTGMVLGILPAPGPYAAGVAWHDGKLWNVDFQTRKLYALQVRGEQMYRLSEPRTARIEFAAVVYNYGPGELRDLVVNLALPETLPGQELLSEPRFASEPQHIATDQWGQRCAVFTVDRLPAGQRFEAGYQVQARISAISFLILPEMVGTLDEIPAELRARYTIDGTRYRIGSPFIRKAVGEAVGDEHNAYWVARRIYEYIIERVEYEMIGGWDVPEVVLRRGSGSCSEYTFAYIAMCRAAGLPARYQGSVVVRGDDACVDDVFHRWAEVYLPNYGWVPVDPSRGDSPVPAERCRGFGMLANRFLITTRDGGDSELLGWDYNYHTRYRATGRAHVEQENLAFWEPLEEQTPPQPGKDAQLPVCRPKE